MEHQDSSVVSSEQGASLSQLNQLLQDEQQIHKADDHVALATEGCKATSLVWRERVTQWCYDVVDHLEESRRLVFITMNILDRYVATCNNVTSDHAFEAAALTALFLAVRIRGTQVLEVIDLVRMSRLGVTIREIVQVGKEMTRALSFDKKLVTPTDFLPHLLALLPSFDSTQIDDAISNATFFTELCVVDSFFVGARASEIALASVMNVLGDKDVSFLTEVINSNPGLKGVSMNKVNTLRNRLNVVRHKTSAGQPHLILDTDDAQHVSVVPLLSPPVMRVVSQEKLGMKRSFSCQTLATLIEADVSPEQPQRAATTEKPSNKRRRIAD